MCPRLLWLSGDEGAVFYTFRVVCHLLWALQHLKSPQHPMRAAQPFTAWSVQVQSTSVFPSTQHSPVHTSLNVSLFEMEGHRLSEALLSCEGILTCSDRDDSTMWVAESPRQAVSPEALQGPPAKGRLMTKILNFILTHAAAVRSLF
ncbi:hypothetical protein CB1_001131008 [Camelus ferus]|nr:hypothetical protein CB1_001131008 [Camelus ferus]